MTRPPDQRQPSPRSIVSYRMAPPRRRSMAGPLVFVLVLVGLAVIVAGQGQTLAGDAVMGLVADRDTLLRQGAIRGVVASRLGPATDLSADPRAPMRDFEVRKGETAADVARRLENDGMLRSRLAFLLVLYESGREGDLQAGVHRLSGAMTPREIAEVLLRRSPEDQVTLRIIEGWRLTETAAEVSRTFPQITPDAFLAAAVVGTHSQPTLAGLDPATALEGFLYPDTYFFKRAASLDTIVTKLLDTFEAKAGDAVRAAAAEQKRSAYDIVKLASIVEREARDRSESPVIAGVYFNRLRIGMKLDADPTIQYALGSWRELLQDDLKLDSPYNTYRVAGLPPTPICSPGLAALQGAAKPARHDFLYFVARGDASGQHLFAKTLEEQEANRVKVGNRP